MNSKSIGERTEAIVLAEFIKSDFAVLLPFGDNQRYDMVIDINNVFYRVQCKTARLLYHSDEVLSFPAHSTYAHRKRGSKGYHGDADLFAIYSPHTDQVYIIPVDEVGEGDVCLRLKSARNNQRTRMADDYTFERWRSGITQLAELLPVKKTVTGSSPVAGAETKEITAMVA